MCRPQHKSLPIPYFVVVFLDNIPSLPLKHNIDIFNECEEGTRPISIQKHPTSLEDRMELIVKLKDLLDNRFINLNVPF